MKKLFQFFLFFPLIAFGQKEFTPDISINGVSLVDYQSFENKFSFYKLPDYFEADHPPELEFISADKKQKFTVFHCYGDHKNSICTFRVEFRKISDLIPVYGVVINDKKFLSGKGIYLGMTLDEFKKKVGTNKYKFFIEKGKTRIVIKYDDFKENKFLQSYNTPEYLAEYYFKNGRLIFFEFGFPNP